MAKLCIWLPPLAADYSGVCSVFFDLNCITAVSDASCCTDNYANYDEPRWAEQRKNVFCISLRTLDAVLGNDAKIVSRIAEAAAVLRPELIAFVGTPVPALIGMDVEGIACEIEAASGIPSLGFSSTGFRYYNEGIGMAGSALADRFAEENLPVVSRRLNILGVTPLDFGNVGNDRDMRAFFTAAGFDVRCFFMGMSLDDVRGIGTAGVNLAVSSAGLVLARRLKERFGTPYIACCPCGVRLAERIVSALNEESLQAPAAGSGSFALLIVADRVFGDSLRCALRLAGCVSRIAVGSLFAGEPTEDGDIFFRTERELVETVRSGKFTAVCGDPYLWRFPGAERVRRYEIVHPAVSSTLTQKEVPRLLSSEFDELIEKIVKEMNDEV